MAVKSYPVVIMAGGPTPGAILEAGEPEKERAFIDVGGRPMLAWVVDAIRKSDVCGEILCIGNAERMQSTFNLKPGETLPQKNTMLENYMAGMEYYQDRDRVIIATCDIPLLTSESMDFLGGEVDRIDAEIFYPIIDVREYDSKYPGGKRTTQCLKEGTFTGGNVFIVNPKKILENREKIEAVIRDRKSPAKLVRLFGFMFVLKFIFKQLDIEGLENKASSIFGAKLKAVITPFPEIGFDVDKPEDLVMTRKYIGHA
jgi:GTP:adenosylcobinamide-phosphate guanylyltransferase